MGRPQLPPPGAPPLQAVGTGCPPMLESVGRETAPGRSRDRVVGGLNPQRLGGRRPAVDSRFAALGTCTWGFRSPSRRSVLVPAQGRSLMPGSQPDAAGAPVGFQNTRVSHGGSGSRQVLELCVCLSHPSQLPAILLPSASGQAVPHSVLPALWARTSPLSVALRGKLMDDVSLIIVNRYLITSLPGPTRPHISCSAVPHLVL